MSVGQKIHFVPQVLESAFPKSIVQLDAIPPLPYRRTECIQSLSCNVSTASNPSLFQNVMSEATRRSVFDVDRPTEPYADRDSSVDVPKKATAAQTATRK